MKVLIVGSGGREHALAWKFGREPASTTVICAPGNAGIARSFACLPVAAGDPAAILALVEREHVDLTVIGPEQPLTCGTADVLCAAGHPVFGPSRSAARLESSKSFAKSVMERNGVPTARHVTCESAAAALDVIREAPFGFPIVLKADGLAAGKGVIIAPDAASATAAIKDMMVDRRFGDAGAQVVIEEFLEGREASFFVITDGDRVRVLPSAEDHKRAFDGDRGPNTGGMGAFAPSPLIDEAASGRILDEIVFPTLRGMKAAGNPYCGFLYCGLMMTAAGPKVIEFNARMGDPETQVVMPALDEELVPHLLAAARGSLEAGVCRARADKHVGVVMASGGYPDAFETGKPVSGLDAVAGMPDVWVFHAGTALRDGVLVTSGGRVLTVVGRGPDYASAIARAYAAVGRIAFAAAHVRRDIGTRALETPPRK